MNEQRTNRVWIELERPGKVLPKGTPDERKAFADKQCELANNVLAKLGVDWSHFWWHADKATYCITIDRGGSFLECADNGHWFSLDYLGRPAPKAGPIGDPEVLGPTEVIGSIPSG